MSPGLHAISLRPYAYARLWPVRNVLFILKGTEPAPYFGLSHVSCAFRLTPWSARTVRSSCSSFRNSVQLQILILAAILVRTGPIALLLCALPSRLGAVQASPPSLPPRPARPGGSCCECRSGQSAQFSSGSSTSKTASQTQSVFIIACHGAQCKYTSVVASFPNVFAFSAIA